MGKIIGILQPGYLPWLGFFDQLARADVFVFYDDVQYDKGGWRNRNRIKTPQGPQWLTVPVLTRGEQFPAVRDVRINPQEPWAVKHCKTLRQQYSKAPFIDAYAPSLFELLKQPWERLCELDIACIDWLAKAFDIRTPCVRSSELGVSGGRTSRLIEIIHLLGGDIFYEGAAGKNYIDPNEFRAHGIEVFFQEYVHPIYPQLHGEFISHLSAVDLLFNMGPDSRDVLLGEQTMRIP